MAKFEQADEGVHAPGPHKYWNESFYMNFFDRAGDWGGASRIGFSPNQGFAAGQEQDHEPVGATGFIRAWEGVGAKRERIGVEGIEHECVAPFERWRVSYRGPFFYFDDPPVMGEFQQTMLRDLPRKEIELEIEFSALHPVFDFHDSMRKKLVPAAEIFAKLRPGYFFNHLGPALRKIQLLKVMSGAQHYEHAGAIKGVVKLDGEERVFEGFGQRDHSWGVRDMRVPANWRWFSGQFTDELCFNAITLDVMGFRASGGYVFHDGVAEALRDWSLDARMADSQSWANSVSLKLLTKSGKRFAVTGDARANVPVVVHTGGYVTRVDEARALFAWDGKTGHGISEFMGQCY